MHRGEDTAYYVARGHRVVAVDADATLIEEAEKRFASELQSGHLELVHAAITERSGETVRFHLSRNTVWSSLDPGISSREGTAYETVEAETTALADLMHDYGT